MPGRCRSCRGAAAAATRRKCCMPVVDSRRWRGVLRRRSFGEILGLASPALPALLERCLSGEAVAVVNGFRSGPFRHFLFTKQHSFVPASVLRLRGQAEEGCRLLLSKQDAALASMVGPLQLGEPATWTYQLFSYSFARRFTFCVVATDGSGGERSVLPCQPSIRHDISQSTPFSSTLLSVPNLPSPSCMTLCLYRDGSASEASLPSVLAVPGPLVPASEPSSLSSEDVHVCPCVRGETTSQSGMSQSV